MVGDFQGLAYYLIAGINNSKGCSKEMISIICEHAYCGVQQPTYAARQTYGKGLIQSGEYVLHDHKKSMTA